MSNVYVFNVLVSLFFPPVWVAKTQSWLNISPVLHLQHETWTWPLIYCPSDWSPLKCMTTKLHAAWVILCPSLVHFHPHSPECLTNIFSSAFKFLKFLTFYLLIADDLASYIAEKIKTTGRAFPQPTTTPSATYPNFYLQTFPSLLLTMGELFLLPTKELSLVL